MEEKLVTVAIHTYERAQILKTLLESEGIETYIHNVNLIQPTISAGVRVRIKDSDLPRALKIIEEMNKAIEKEEKPKKEKKKILIPIDFSDYSQEACELGFRLASTMKAEIAILHTYFSPIYTGMPMGEALAYEMNNEETLVRIVKKVQEDVDNFGRSLQERIKKGTLPEVKFEIIVREGVPEEEIIRYGKENELSLIIMGTRGKNKKDLDLIGSVTAEVIERSLTPVLAIPEDTAFKDFEKLKRIAYATNFDQKDLIAFEKMMQFLNPFKFKIYFVHISPKNDAWDEIKLEGIKAYFKKHYPNLETEYVIIKSEDILASLDEFIHKNKIDILSLTTHKRNIFTRLFNPSVARKMIFHTDTPMLVFHA